METISGKRIDIFNLKEEDICPYDAARGMSQISRFGGQSNGVISVANHSVTMARYFYTLGMFKEAWEALWHDSDEYILGSDVITPLKHHYKMKFYRKICNDILKVILRKFGIKKISKVVKELDDKMKVLEARLVKPDSDLAKKEVDIDLEVKLMSAEESEKAFLEMYNQLSCKLNG